MAARGDVHERLITSWIGTSVRNAAFGIVPHRAQSRPSASRQWAFRNLRQIPALALDLLAESMNQPPPRAIEAGQQAAPNVRARPKSFSRDCIVHGEIGIGWALAEMKGQIWSTTTIL